MSDDNLTAYEVTYAGRAMNKGKTVWRFRDERDGAIYLYGKNPVRMSKIGAVYEVHENESGHMIVSGPRAPKYVRSLPHNDPDVTRWRAADEAIEIERNRQSALRKAGDPFDEILQRVSEASTTLTSPQRRALAVRLLEALWLS